MTDNLAGPAHASINHDSIKKKFLLISINPLMQFVFFGPLSLLVVIGNGFDT